MRTHRLLITSLVTLGLTLPLKHAKAGIQIAFTRDLNILSAEMDHVNPQHGIPWAELELVAAHAELAPGEGDRLAQVAKALFTRTGSYVPSSLPTARVFSPKLIGQWLGAVALCAELPDLAECTKEAIARAAISALPAPVEQNPEPTHGVMRSARRTHRNTGTNYDAKHLKNIRDLDILARRSLELRNDSRFYRIFLALLWHRVTTKADYLDYYQGLANAWKAHPDFLARAFRVNWREWQNDANPERLAFLSAQFTREDIVEPADSGSRRHRSSYVPFEPYDLHLYTLLRDRLSAPAVPSHAEVTFVPAGAPDAVSMTDCSENTLRALLIQILYRPHGAFLADDLDLRILDKLGFLREIRAFFAAAPSTTLQRSNDGLHQQWAYLMSNRPGVVYKQTEATTGFRYEVTTLSKSGARGANNFLLLVNSVVATPFASWEEFGAAIDRARKEVSAMPPPAPPVDFSLVFGSLAFAPSAPLTAPPAPLAAAYAQADDVVPMEQEARPAAPNDTEESSDFAFDFKKLNGDFGGIGFTIHGNRFQLAFLSDYAHVYLNKLPTPLDGVNYVVENVANAGGGSSLNLYQERPSQADPAQERNETFSGSFDRTSSLAMRVLDEWPLYRIDSYEGPSEGEIANAVMLTPYVTLNNDDAIHRYADHIGAHLAPPAIVGLLNRVTTIGTAHNMVYSLMNKPTGRDKVAEVLTHPGLTPDPIYAPVLNQLGRFEDAVRMAALEERRPAFLGTRFGHTASILLTKFIGDKSLLIVSSDGHAVINDLQTGLSIVLPRTDQERLFSAKLSASRTMLAVAGKNMAYAYDITQPQNMPMLVGPVGATIGRLTRRGIALSPLGDRIAIERNPGFFISGRGFADGHEHRVPDNVTIKGFSPDGNRLLLQKEYANQSYIVRLDDDGKAEVERTVENEYWSQSAAFSPNGQMFVTTSRGDGMLFWEVGNQSRVPAFRSRTSHYAQAFHNSPDGTRLFALMENGIDEWDWGNLAAGPKV